MSYQLNQTPVPFWAVQNPGVFSFDPEKLPAFILDGDAPNSARQGRNGDAKPVFLKQAGRWNSVMDPYAEGQARTANGRDPAMLNQYDFSKKWENTLEQPEDSPNGIVKFDKFKASFVKNLAGNPFFPIALRGSASTFAIIALSLSCAVFVQTKHVRTAVEGFLPHGEAASTIFSIVLCCISIVYLLYSLWNETFGQPLGLRSPQSKIKFVTMDLVLMCLTAANLAIAFETMIAKPYICPALQNHRVCKLQKALVSFIFVTLVVWFLTFLVSMFRMIDRATH